MNYSIKLKKHVFLLMACMAMVWTSCKVEKIAPVAESVKDITGTWKVVAATRNGTNLVPIFDYTQFSVKFDGSANTYTLVNPVPFIVNANGTYALDNPNYPFQITFTAAAGTPIVTAFNYPIIGGVRQINLTFSPGCTQNIYVYTLVKSN